MMVRMLLVVGVAAALSGCVEVERERTPHSSPIPDPVPKPKNVQRVSDATQESGAERISDDGRPEWWFPEVRREGGVLVLCVETIAPGSLRDANRAAVEVASTRAAIETRRAGYVFDEGAMSIEKSWGWPLPSLPGRDPGYAGYAMVSVDLGDLSPQGTR
ncbi:MAG: hypothetical protein AAGH64_07310 [Planctomycetota bacterium]